MLLKPTYGQCLQCPPGEKLLANKSKKLCQYHNRISKSLTYAAKKLTKAFIGNHKPIKPGNKNAAKNARFNRKIWKEREHKCVECGCQLPEKFNSCYISHIVPRGANIFLAYDPANVQIHCLKCHNRWDGGDRKGMKSFSQDIYDSLTLKSYSNGR